MTLNRTVEKPQASYRQILKSSLILGGAQAIVMVLELVRVKFAAILIGPVGIGLYGTFQSTSSMLQTFFGLGLRESAVRNVALAFATGDEQEIGKTIRTLRRLVWITGVAGAMAMALGAPWLSEWTFGESAYAPDLALMGLALLCMNLRKGQMALIQGARRVADLARLKIAGAALGVGVTLPLYWQLGLRGIVPALLTVAAAELLISWLYARRIPVPEVTLGWRETVRRSGGMVRLGLAFMWTSLLLAAVGYLVRVLIIRVENLESVGLYAAAFAVSGLLIRAVMQAMQTDYYPRLSAVSDQPAAMRALVNEQTEVGMLLTLPGLLALLTLGQWLIPLLYSAEFGGAVPLLYWFAIGSALKVIVWPMAYILIAMGRARDYSLLEMVSQCVHFGLVALLLAQFGLIGVAIAFFAHLFLHALMVWAVAGRLIEFRWSPNATRLAKAFLLLLVATFASAQLFPPTLHALLGSMLTAGAALFCLRALVARVGVEHRLVRGLCGFSWGRVACGVPRPERDAAD